MRIRTLKLLCAICAVAISSFAAIAIQALHGGDLELEARPVVAWSPPPEIPSEAMPDRATAPDMQAILARPIFMPDRKPFVAAPPSQAVQQKVQLVATPPPQPNIQAPNIVLKGVLLTSSLGKAFVTTPESPDGTWLTIGKNIDGWTLTAITKSSAKFSEGEQKIELQLYVDNPANTVGLVAPGN